MTLLCLSFVQFWSSHLPAWLKSIFLRMMDLPPGQILLFHHIESLFSFLGLSLSRDSTMHQTSARFGEVDISPFVRTLWKKPVVSLALNARICSFLSDWVAGKTLLTASHLQVSRLRSLADAAWNAEAQGWWVEGVWLLGGDGILYQEQNGDRVVAVVAVDASENAWKRSNLKVVIWGSMNPSDLFQFTATFRRNHGILPLASNMTSSSHPRWLVFLRPRMSWNLSQIVGVIFLGTSETEIGWSCFRADFN